MQSDDKAVTLIPIDDDEAGDALLRRLNDEAKPDTVQRIKRIINGGITADKSTQAIAEEIAEMIFVGDPINE